MPTHRELRRSYLVILLLAGFVFMGVNPGRAAEDVVAEVNGEPITRQSFQADYRKAVRDYARKGNPVNEAYLKDLRKRLILYLVESELLLQDARKHGIRVTDEELDRILAAEREASGGEAGFSAKLGQMGLSEAEYRERRRKARIIEKLITDHIARDVVVSNEDINAYYRQHPERFRIPEYLHIRHITLRFPSEADDARKSAVRDRILAIQSQITAGGDFEELARELTEDPNRSKGGDAGFMDAEAAAQRFGQRVLDIPTGQVGPLLETPWGYHLVAIEARQPPRAIPLDQVREWIRQTLFQQRTGAPVKAYVQTLRENAKIVIHE